MFHPWNDWAVVRGSLKCKLFLVPMWQNDLAGGSSVNVPCEPQKAVTFRYDRMTFNRTFQATASCRAVTFWLQHWTLRYDSICVSSARTTSWMRNAHPLSLVCGGIFSSVLPGVTQWGWELLMDCRVWPWTSYSVAGTPHNKAFWLNRLHACFQTDSDKNSHYGPRRPLITYSVTDL